MQEATCSPDLAAAWNKARVENSRPLTLEEWDALNAGRELLLQHLPRQIRSRNLVLEAIELLTPKHFRVDETRDKNSLGVVTIFRNSPLNCTSIELRGRLIKAASVLAVRRHMGRLLRVDIAQMDYFAEEFCRHGFLVGRAVKLVGMMLGRCNAQIYHVMEQKGVHGEEFTTLLLFAMEGPATRERRTIYAQPVTNAKPGYLVPGHKRAFYERRVWSIFFRTEGPKFYAWEVRGDKDTALSRSMAKIRKEALRGR